MNCIECDKLIPQVRINAWKKRTIITCSKRCSVRRSLKASRDRKPQTK